MIKRYAGIVARMHDEGGGVNLGQQRAYIGIAVRDQVARSVFGRRRDPLQLIEPVGLLLGSARNELRREKLAKSWIFLAPT